MEYESQTVVGPRTASVSRKDALISLQEHDQFPQGAVVADVDERNGHWVAELRVPKTAAPPPFLDDEGPDEEPKPPSEKKEGPPKDEVSPDDADTPPSDDESDEGPPKSDDEGKKPSVEDSIAHLTSLVQQLADALGIGPGGPPGHPGAGPEADAGLTPPPPGPPGHAGPGKGPTGPGRPLKPGDAPNAPGVTPVGAPAFASVREDHPWRELAGKTASFTVTNAIEEGDDERIISKSAAELRPLAEEIGYKVGQIRRGTDEDGNPVVKALITAR